MSALLLHFLGGVSGVPCRLPGSGCVELAQEGFAFQVRSDSTAALSATDKLAGKSVVTNFVAAELEPGKSGDSELDCLKGVVLPLPIAGGKNLWSPCAMAGPKPWLSRLCYAWLVAVVWVPYVSLVAGTTSVGLYDPPPPFPLPTHPTLSARKVPVVLSWFVVLWRFRSCRGSRGLLL